MAAVATCIDDLHARYPPTAPSHVAPQGVQMDFNEPSSADEWEAEEWTESCREWKETDLTLFAGEVTAQSPEPHPRPQRERAIV